ncbi:MAG TPA: DUF881 domain-containing protein [Nocardioides sp.]|nr:DUF881 domain-containing protein [Nocardioides sp.]
MPEQPPTEERVDLPARVTMPLLTLITQQSLDEDYQQAAERRQAGLAGPRAGRPWVTAAVVVAVFGVLVSTAAVQTSRNADVDDAGRATLIERIENQRDRVSRQQDRIARLRSRNSAVGDQLTTLTASVEAVGARLARLRVSTGFVAVEGEGVRVSVDDADTGDPNGIVRDNDLALLVNGLWSAGAEAISVNGQRITAMTSIRTSGRAIEVNSVGIAPPYTVLAIGDRSSLQADFFDTTSGLAFDGLTRRYGMTFDMDNEDQLSLPAASSQLLRLRSVRAGVEGEEHEPAPGEEPE